MESTEFNEVTKVEIPKTKKKKNRKKKKDNGFEVTSMNIVDKPNGGDTTDVAENINENPIVSEESNMSISDVEFKTKKKKKKKNNDTSDISEPVESKPKKGKKRKNIEISDKN